MGCGGLEVGGGEGGGGGDDGERMGECLKLRSRDLYIKLGKDQCIRAWGDDANGMGERSQLPTHLILGTIFGGYVWYSVILPQPGETGRIMSACLINGFQ